MAGYLLEWEGICVAQEGNSTLIGQDVRAVYILKPEEPPLVPHPMGLGKGGPEITDSMM